jgi:DNA-binding CsgD family transcriptional regulator
MPKGARRPTAKSMVLAKDRERECLSLRKAGATYDQIAERVGITREGARGAVARALAALSDVCTEEAKEVRQLELDRLDVMLLGIWDQARRGDVQAIDRVLRIQERRAKFLSLDMPDKIQMSGDINVIRRIIVDKAKDDPGSP